MNRSHLVGWISAIFLLLSSFSVSAQDGEDRPVITPENADQLQQIAMIGCGHIYDMVISPNGQTIAIAGSAGVCFYDRTAGKSFIQTLNGHNGRAHSIAFSPDGHTLAVGGENNQIELWDIPSGEQTGQLDDLPTLVQKIVFNPDGTRLAYQSAYQYEDVIYIWNLETQSVEWSIQDYFLTLIGFAPDGTLLIVDERDLMSDPGNVQVRRVSVSGEITVVVLDDVIPRNENIWHYAGSADGRLIAGGSSKGTVRVWNTVTGELLAVFDAQASRVSAVAFSPDGSKLITLSGDNYDTTARLWDVASGHWETTVEDIDGNGAVFSPDGTTVFITTSDSMLHAWNIKTNEHAILASGHRAWHIGNVEHITFSTDGTQLLSDGQDGSRLWDVATGKEEDLAIKGYFSHVASTLGRKKDKG